MHYSKVFQRQLKMKSTARRGYPVVIEGHLLRLVEELLPVTNREWDEIARRIYLLTTKPIGGLVLKTVFEEHLYYPPKENGENLTLAQVLRSKIADRTEILKRIQREHNKRRRKNCEEDKSSPNFKLQNERKSPCDGESTTDTMSTDTLIPFSMSGSAQTKEESEFERQMTAYLSTINDMDDYVKNYRPTVDSVLINIFSMIHGKKSYLQQDK